MKQKEKVNRKKKIVALVSLVLMLTLFSSTALSVLATPAEEKVESISTIENTAISNSENEAVVSSGISSNSLGDEALSKVLTDETELPNSSLAEEVEEEFLNEDVAENEIALFATEESGTFELTADLLSGGKYNIANLPVDTHTITVNTGTVAILSGSNSAVPDIQIQPQSGVEIAVGTKVGNITTTTAPGETIKNIVVRGISETIVVKTGTHVEGVPYNYITVGAYSSGAIEGNIVLEDDVTVQLTRDSYVGIGAYNEAKVKGDILIGDNVVVRNAADGTVKTTIGASTKSEIHDIVIGSGIDIDVITDNASSVIGVQASTGNDVTVGPNAKIRFTRPAVFGGGQAVAVGAAGYNGSPGKLNTITMLSNPEPTSYSNIDIYQGVGVGVYNEGNANNVIVGDNIRVYSHNNGAQGNNIPPTLIGISAAFSTESSIEGNVTVGNNVQLDSLLRSNLGIGSSYSKINGNIIIGDNLQLKQTLVGVGSLATNGNATIHDVTIGNNAQIESNMVAVGAYMGYITYGAQIGNITVGNDAKITAASTAVGVFGRNNTNGGSIRIGKNTLITAGRLGVGAINGAQLNGDITIKEGTTIRFNSSTSAGGFVAVGVGEEERVLKYTGQKVNGNILIEGDLAIYFAKERPNFPFVNLIGNQDGEITIFQGNIYATSLEEMKVLPVSFDRLPINKYGESLFAHTIAYQSTPYTVLVPAAYNIVEYTYKATPAWSGEAANGNNPMIVYLPKRDLQATETIPKQNESKYEEVDKWISVTFNAPIKGINNIKEELGHAVSLYNAKDNSLEASIIINQENMDVGIYSFVNPSGVENGNTLYINLTKLELPINQNYYAEILAGTFQDTIGYMQQVEDIKWNFRLVQKQIVPPASSSSAPPVSSSTHPTSSGVQPTSSDTQPTTSSAAPVSNGTASSINSSVNSASSNSNLPSSQVSNTIQVSSSQSSSNLPMISSSTRGSSSRLLNNAGGADSGGSGAGSVSSSASALGGENINNAESNRETLSQLMEEGVPTFTIGDSELPLFGSSLTTWSIINLIIAIIGVAISVILIILFLIKRKNETETSSFSKKIFIYTLGAILLGFISVITFFMLEKLSSLMVLFNQWTLLMVFLLGLQLFVLYLARRVGKIKQAKTKDLV